MLDTQVFLDNFLPEGIDWSRYELVEIRRISDDDIPPFIGRLEFHIEEKNKVPE